jgi:large subunit ribosomal protein L31
MRDKIHPKWYPDAKVVCAACKNTWTVGATRPNLSVDVCSNCHPFYTGEQRIVDTEGRVDRFMKRLEVRTTFTAEQEVKTIAEADLALSELGLGKQYTELLAANNMATAKQFVAKLTEIGDEGILEIRGVGRKLLTDVKKKLRARGFDVPVSKQD